MATKREVNPQFKQDVVTFLASIPAILSALKISGNGDGMRVQFDIPESEMGNAVKLLVMRDKVLKITIEVEAE